MGLGKIVLEHMNGFLGVVLMPLLTDAFFTIWIAQSGSAISIQLSLLPVKKATDSLIRVHQSKCSSCSFEANVRVGARIGEYNNYDIHPALCLNCGLFDSVNTVQQPHKCSDCGSTDVILYGEHTRKPGSAIGLRRTSYFTETNTPWFDGVHSCPNCGQHALTFGPPKLSYS